MSKFDRLFKINVGHNQSEAFDFHDVCRVLLVRILRRKYKNSEIYTEFHPLRQNEVYPDIFVKTKQGNFIIELQSEITKEWEDKINKNYPNEDVLIIPLKLVERKLEIKQDQETFMSVSENPINLLRKILEEYL